MDTLPQYIANHTECIQNDKQLTPIELSKTADLISFKIKITNNPCAKELKELVTDFKGNDGIFTKFNTDTKILELFNPFDGEEHSYIELGAWLGHQHLALEFIGLCCLLNIATLLTPDTILPPNSIDKSMRLKMAGMGLITMMAKK